MLHPKHSGQGLRSSWTDLKASSLLLILSCLTQRPKTKEQWILQNLRLEECCTRAAEYGALGTGLVWQILKAAAAVPNSHRLPFLLPLCLHEMVSNTSPAVNPKTPPQTPTDPETQTVSDAPKETKEVPVATSKSPASDSQMPSQLVAARRLLESTTRRRGEEADIKNDQNARIGT